MTFAFSTHWLTRFCRTASRNRRYHRPSSRLALETLEQRSLLSVLVVTNNRDNGSGSLRGALAIAQDRDTILFDPSLHGQTITLTSGELVVDKDLTITGPGADSLTISGHRASRVFEVEGTDVRLSGLTIAHGNAHEGSGIWSGAELTVVDCILSGNVADDQAGGILNSGILTVNGCTFMNNVAPYSAAILNNGKSTVADSTVIGNTASEEGGGLCNTGVMQITSCTIARNVAGSDSGGLFSDGLLALTNSTLADNVAGYGGGGIYGLGVIAIRSCTVTGNVAGIAGGGIRSGASLSVQNTIIADNAAPFSPDIDGELTSLGHNLVGDAHHGTGFSPSDLLDTDPRLCALRDNGGPTQTMALLPGSPALGAGDPALAGTADQRGVVRSGHVNIGAYQASASAFAVTAPDTVTAGVPFEVTVTAVDTFGQTAFGYTGTVTFSATDHGNGVVLPLDYTFMPDGVGVHTFTNTGLGETTLVTPLVESITVTDAVDATITGSAVVEVAPPPAPSAASVGERQPPLMADGLDSDLRSSLWARKGRKTGFSCGCP
jgi:hypothetical protein